MKKLLFILLSISASVAAQETEFTFNNERGMTDFVVTNVEGKTAPEIYKKAIEWIKVTFKNPDKVLLSTIENEYVRFEGFSETLYSYNALGQHYEPTKFEIEISIKDGKYKFDLIGMQSLAASSATSAGGWYDVKFFTTPMNQEDLEKAYVFKKDGTLRSAFKYANEVPTYFNNLNKALLDYVVVSQKKNDGW
jgi:hypothetical protein